MIGSPSPPFHRDPKQLSPEYQESVTRFKGTVRLIHSYSYFYSTTKHEIIQIKNHNCFDWLAYYKRIRIVNK